MAFRWPLGIALVLALNGSYVSDACLLCPAPDPPPECADLGPGVTVCHDGNQTKVMIMFEAAEGGTPWVYFGPGENNGIGGIFGGCTFVVSPCSGDWNSVNDCDDLCWSYPE